MDTAMISVMPEDKRKEKVERTYSNETFYTDSNEGFRSKCKSAANLLHKRRQLHPLLGTGIGDPYRATSNYGARFISFNSPSKTNMNGYSHKIVSAKLLRVKQLQNELTDAQFQLNELCTENRLLKTLQKRQDLALSKYEDTKAELPQLIRSHNEEVRILKSKVKQLKSQCREKDHRIKELDADLQNLRDQHRHLLRLSRDRHLGDREQLTKKVEELQDIIKDQDTRIQTLNRKVMLETKNYKHQLSTEMTHHKETQRDLSEALEKISKLEIMVETKEKYIATFVPKRNFRNNNRQSVSLVSLAGPSRYPDLQTTMKSAVDLIPKLEEESSEGTFMASQTDTSYGSTRPSTGAVQLKSESKMPSDGYNARRIKLANKRKVMLDENSVESITNKANDVVSTSGLTSPTPSSSSVLNDDRDADLMDDNASKHPYSFGTAYSSRKSSLNTETSRKLSLQDEGKSSLVEQRTHKNENLTKSHSVESLEEGHKDQSTYTRTNRRGSFQENLRKDLFTNLMDDMKEEIGLRRNSLLNMELKSIIEGSLKDSLSVNKNRRGSLIKEKKNSNEEESMPPIINKNSSRRGSLKREKKSSVDEDTIPIITNNKSSSRKGSLKREKRKAIEEESIPAISNNDVSRMESSIRENRNSVEESFLALKNKNSSWKESIQLEKNLDVEGVKEVASIVGDKENVLSMENDLETDRTSNYRFTESSEHLTEISQTWNRIQNTILTERELTESKLKEFGSTDATSTLENKGYEKEKLLAALKAIDDGEDPITVNAENENSSLLDSLFTNSSAAPGLESNVSLPFIGQMRALDHQWDSKVVSKERSTSVDRPKTKNDLIQELFGVQSGDFTAQSNNNA